MFSPSKLFAFTLTIGLASVPAFSLAGFTVETGLTNITNTDPGNNGATVGDQFFTSLSGTFAAYIPDTPADPQLTGADLPFYRYTFDGAVSGVNGNVVSYNGTYNIFYDANQNGLFDEGLSVSAGTFAIDAIFAVGNTAALNGFLTQTQGPSNPAFADLSYGGFPVSYTGTYVGNPTDPLQGTIQGTLRQNAAPVPEPASLAALGLGAVALLKKRRKNKAA